jgi:hypothetical protein
VTGFTPEFEQALARIFALLGQELWHRDLVPVLDASAAAPRVQEGRVHVPVRFEVHWRRFQTLPTDLVRDAAYAAARQSGRDEADAMVFAEVFLREHVLNAPE